MTLSTVHEPPALQLSDASKSRLRPWQKLLLITALAWALVVVVPDVYRLYAPLGTLGFSADNNGQIYEVYDEPATIADLPGAPRRGLKEGDAIRLKPGPCWHPTSEDCRNLLAVFGGMGGLAYVREGTSVVLPVVTKEGQDANVGLSAKSDRLEPGARFWLALDEFFAIFVLWRAFKLVWDRFSRMTLGFFLYVIWFNPGQYFAYYAWLQGHPVLLLIQEGLQAVAQGAGYAGFLIFALRFPHDRTEPNFRGIERLALVAGAVLAVLQLSSFANVFGYGTEIVTRCAVLGGYAVALYSFYIVWHRQKLQSPIDYQRMRWVLWGCAIGLPAFIFADSNEATSLWDYYVWHGSRPDESILEIGYLLSGVLAVFICEAVRRPRILNVSCGLRRLGAVGIVLLAFAIVEAQMHDRLDHMFIAVGLPGGLQFPTSVVAALVCSVMCHRGTHIAEHVLNRSFYHEAERLEEQGVAAKDSSSIEAIDAMLANGPSETLRLASAAVFRDVGGVFRRVAASRGWNDEYGSELRSPADMNLLGDLAKGRAVRLRLKSADASETAAAISAPALAVPVVILGKLYAVALYGPHETGDDIDPLEKEILEKFARQVAVGYETARLSSLERELETIHHQHDEKPAATS